MSDVVIRVESLSKQYRLGLIGTGTLSHDLNRWWCRMRRKEDPYLKVTQTNVREESGDSEFVWALRDVNFEVKQGEVLGIIGRNGAGKSTLLKILSRVTAPTTGCAKIRGRIASLLEVGTGFHPELTGRENIYLNGAILGMTKAEIAGKLDEIVAFSGCERYLDTPVKRYSSGMMVRLGFAVAAHLEPEILIVDEVLAVGDAEFQKKCVGKMKDVAGHGRTVLFVSHNMASVQALCSSAMVLRQGYIGETGETADCIRSYISESTRRTGSILSHQHGGVGGAVQPHSVKANGSESDNLRLSTASVGIDLEFVFEARAACNVAFDCFLKDANGSRLAIGSPGHQNASVYGVDRGRHRLDAHIKLPDLAKGTYLMDIGLSTPGREHLTTIPDALKIVIDGHRTATGVVFESGAINGFLVLDTTTTLEAE